MEEMMNCLSQGKGFSDHPRSFAHTAVMIGLSRLLRRPTVRIQQLWYVEGYSFSATKMRAAKVMWWFTKNQVAFLTAGYPTRADTVPLLLALQEGGADVIELGVPFTDPQADGTTIQKASQVKVSMPCCALNKPVKVLKGVKPFHSSFLHPDCSPQQGEAWRLPQVCQRSPQ